MQRTEILKYNDNEFIFLNGDKANREDTIRIFEELDEYVLKFKKREALILINLNNCYLGMDVAQKYKDITKEHYPFVKKIAIYGVRGLAKITYKSYISYIKMKGFDADSWIKTFDNPEDAKNWLTS